MKAWKSMLWFGRIIFAAVLFALGFDLFLLPNELNAGGISGLAMVLVEFLGFGTVGAVVTVANLPLFALGGIKLGRRFFVGSMVGMIALSVFLDAFALISPPETEPLLGTLYGGLLCGLGAGVVFSAGASTGGSDIIVRLLKLRFQNVPIGQITICFDLVVAALTGLAFRDITKALYSGVAIFVTGQVLDAVVYRFDYSRVALIISAEHEKIAAAIARELRRGVTFLEGQGAYSGKATRVVLTAVRRQQLAELKKTVVAIDPGAFIIVQEAHQVLGDGFSRYSRESL